MFCLTRDLLVAFRELVLRKRQKVTVSFYESPWEIVLYREGEQVLVSFLRVGSAPEVVVQDHPVPLFSVGGTLITAAKRLLSCARRFDENLARDPLVEELDLLCAQVRGAILGYVSTEEAADIVSIPYKTASYEKGQGGRLSFSFMLKASSRDILGPVIKGRADLHSLLVRGTLIAHAVDRKLVVGEGRVFLQVERLLTALKHLLGAWELGKPMHVRLHGDSLQVGLRLTETERVALSLGQVGKGKNAITLTDLGVEEVANPLISLGKDLRRGIKNLAPAQRYNPRFENFGRELDSVENWFRDLTRPSVLDESAEPYEIGDSKGIDEAITQVHLTTTRKLSYQERWWLEAEGLDINGTFLCGDRVVVTARNTVMALDRDRGELLWRIDAKPAYSVMAGHYGLVRLTPSGQTTLVDLRDGRTRWQNELRPRAGLPAGVQVGGTHGPRCVVLAEAERGLVALDLNTGEQRWRFGAWRGRDFALQPAGRLLLVTCGDSAIYALDVDSGELVWRHTARSTFEIKPTAIRDRAIACGGPPGGRDARIFCTDLASGKLQWVKVLDVGVIDSVVGAAGEIAVVPSRHPSGAALLVGLDLETGEEIWRRWLEGWSQYALLSVDDFVVVCGAGGMITAIDAKTGEIRWSHSLGYQDPDDVPRKLEPVLRGGALFVPADSVYVLNPRDGKVIHRLSGDSLVPDILRVDERCGIYVAEEAGYVAAYGVAAQLAVVQ